MIGLNITTQGYGGNITGLDVAVQGYVGGTGFFGILLDLFKPQIKAIKQRFQIKCLN